MIRIATLADVQLLKETRKIQLVHEGIAVSCNIDEDLERWFSDMLGQKRLYQIIFYENDELIATGGYVRYEYPPTYTNKTGRIAYITNMYTSEKYRHQGYAHKIIEMLEQKIREDDIHLIRMGASKLGKPVYLSMGYLVDDTTTWLYKKV